MLAVLRTHISILFKLLSLLTLLLIHVLVVFALNSLNQIVCSTSYNSIADG